RSCVVEGVRALPEELASTGPELRVLVEQGEDPQGLGLAGVTTQGGAGRRARIEERREPGVVGGGLRRGGPAQLGDVGDQGPDALEGFFEALLQRRPAQPLLGEVRGERRAQWALPGEVV